MVHSLIFCAVTSWAVLDTETKTREWIDGDETQILEIIQGWKTAAEETDHVKARIVRFDYNDTFNTVQISEGSILVDRNLGYRLELTSTKPAETNSQFLDWSWKTGGDEFWIRTPTRIYDIDRLNQTVRAVELPLKTYQPKIKKTNNAEALLSYLGQHFVDSLVMSLDRPFALVSPEAVDFIVENCYVSIKITRDKSWAFLACIPNTRELRDHYSRLEIILDLKNNLPAAAQFTDPAKTKRTVYKLSDVQINFADAPDESDFKPDPSFAVRTIGTAKSRD